jgi:predicted 2-oxoglutarate/Fe(II)-dependent dioxygenase YbiX
VLQVGQRAPDFVLPAGDGTTARFYGRAGGVPTALVLPGSAVAPTHSAAVAVAFHGRTEFAAHWIVRDAAVLPEGVDGFVDADGALSAELGVDAVHGTVILLDPNLRVVAIESLETAPDAVLAAVLGAAPAVSPGSPAGHDGATVTSQAPVLIVPRVVDADTARALITMCREQSVETGVEKSGDTARVDSVDRALKRRRDVSVTEPEQLRALSAAVGSRLMPEVQRAFAFRATRFEGFKIAWYDDDSGGFFAPHRDNLAVSTAHRVFGLSINLNDDYDGGELVFPEYGDERYRAPAGAAMVFSSSLLHAVLPVVRGSRFVLLSFLYA